MNQISIQQTSPYSFSVLELSLRFLPVSIGLICGDLTGGKGSDYVMHRAAKAAKRYTDEGVIVRVPEDRMRENAWLGILMFPGVLV